MQSRRVTLDPGAYDVERSYGLHKIAMPGDWQIRGSSLPQFIDPVPPSAGVQTVVYGLSNTKHHLMLTAPKGTKPSIAKLRVYRPALAK